jgi:methionyl-tRNA synthetase
MSDPPPKFYLTTPIYYANSRPHVGSAYTTIACDVIARYKRMCGYDVAYVTGTDEHGVNIERAAEKAGVTPQQLVDKNERIFRDLWKLLGIQYTGFVRTTSAEHEKAVQTLVKRTLERDKALPLEQRAIYKDKYEGRYCIYDNLYVSDTPEPVNCPTCGRPAELVSEENYFFRLSAYKGKLEQLYTQNPHYVIPDFRLNEVRSFVDAGLKDISISRKSIKWGVPWPGDPEHVFYVWYDALTSYLTGIGFGREGAEGDADPEYQKYWPADIHAMGKEIIRFHAVYWPAFLMAAGLPVPRQIVAHGWLLFEQEKMSKSKGNVVYPEPIVNALDELTGAKVGNDALRYYLLRETVFGQDGNFSREALLTRYEADLTNGIGNLTSRVLTMIGNYFDGRVPHPESAVEGSQPELEADEEIKGLATTLALSDRPAGVLRRFDHFEFSLGIEAIWLLVSATDSYITSNRPWDLARDDTRRNRLARVLYFAAESIRFAAVLCHAVMPTATQRIWEQLGLEGDLAKQRIDQLEWGGLKPGTRIGKPEWVFPRIKDKKQALEKIEDMENKIRNPGATQAAAASASAISESGPLATSHQLLATGTNAAATSAAVPSTIAIEDFAKMDLRVGQIKSAERIPGADRLLKLLVDLGAETRQILAGIALAYAPEDLIGRKVVIVANLTPRKMRGLESNGMLLAASDGTDGKPVLCTFAEDIAPGAKVK